MAGSIHCTIKNEEVNGQKNKNVFQEDAYRLLAVAVSGVSTRHPSPGTRHSLQDQAPLRDQAPPQDQASPPGPDTPLGPGTLLGPGNPLGPGTPLA